MDKIVQYLINRYDPESIVVYGSYADGTHHLASDFDALVFTKQMDCGRDTAVVEGVQLDVFLVSPEENLQVRDYPQLYHSKVVLDKYGKAARLCDDVKSYIDNLPYKSQAEIGENLVWCEKMLFRTNREDAEGYFRWHWVLCDSLEFYCNIRRKFYFGPKKTLRWMREEDPASYEIYGDALAAMDRKKLERWINHLREISPLEG